MGMSKQGYKSFRLTLKKLPSGPSTTAPELYLSEINQSGKVQFSSDRKLALVEYSYDQGFELFKMVPKNFQEYIEITPSRD